MNGSRLLGLSRTIPYLLFTLAMMPIQAVAVAFDLRLARTFPVFYHRWAMRLLGFEIVVVGTPSNCHPTLFVSNHSSYFDIPILGSLIEASFVAKAEMINWPFFGWLARLQRSVFVDRKPSNVGAHANEITKRLGAGDSLVLFAEGTTSDGNRLLPFKTSLFAVAEQASPERPLTIQPISVTAVGLDGMPLGRSLRPYYSWYGDMPLVGHFWTALCLGRLTVLVEFHPAFPAAGLQRKALAARCRHAVQAGLVRGLTGRSGEAAPALPWGNEGGEEDTIVAAA